MLWKQNRPGGGHLAIRVGRESLDHRRIFNAIVRRLNNDHNLPRTALTDLEFDIKTPIAAASMSSPHGAWPTSCPASFTRWADAAFVPPANLAGVSDGQRLYCPSTVCVRR